MPPRRSLPGDSSTTRVTVCFHTHGHIPASPFMEHAFPCRVYLIRPFGGGPGTSFVGFSITFSRSELLPTIRPSFRFVSVSNFSEIQFLRSSHRIGLRDFNRWSGSIRPASDTSGAYHWNRIRSVLVLVNRVDPSAHPTPNVSRYEQPEWIRPLRR